MRPVIAAAVVALAACSSSTRATAPPPATTTPHTRLVPAASRPAPGPWDGSTAALQMLTDRTGWAVGFACPGCQVPIDATADGGITWRRIPSPIEAAAADAVFSLAAGAGQELWLWSRAHANSLGSALFHSADGGTSWYRVEGLAGIAALAVGPSATWAVEQSCPLAGAPADCTERLVTTRDGGATWAAPAAQPRTAPGADGVQLVLDGGRAWVLSATFTTGFTLAATADDGATWSLLAAPPHDCAGVPAVLAVAGPRRLWFACGGNGATVEERREVARSADGGLTWRVEYDAIATGHLSDLAAVSATTAFIGQCRGSILRSDDGGRTWAEAIPRAQGAPLDGCVSPVVFVGARDGWAAGETSRGGWIVWRTTDGGATWEPVPLT